MAGMNPMVIFWLGVLTGALVVALAFMKGVGADGDAALLRYNPYASSSYSSYSSSPTSTTSIPSPVVGG